MKNNQKAKLPHPVSTGCYWPIKESSLNKKIVLFNLKRKKVAKLS